MSETTMVDQLAEDTKTADAPPEYPEGAPKLFKLLRVPFRQRAEALRRYGEVQDYLKANPKLQKTAGKAGEQADVIAEPDLKAAGKSYEMVALLDDVLAAVAIDPAAYEAWEDRYDIAVFMATWSAWQSASQPGEARSSSS